MYREEYKFEAMEDEEDSKFGFEDSDIAADVEQVFAISNYSIEGSTIKFIKILTVRNNKFWIVTKENALYMMRLGELPELIDNAKFKDSDILFVCADEKGTHCVIGIKTDKPKYELFYLAQNGNTQKIASYDHPEEISSCTIYVPTEDNPDDRVFEILFGTKFGSIYHGRFYLEKKGNFKAEIPISEVIEI